MTKGTLLVTGAAVLAVAAGGGAIAATKLTSPKQDQQAIINDAASQLGVTPTQLSNALKKAVENRIDAAVAAGRITKAQGDALKAKIESAAGVGVVPFLGGPDHDRPGFGPGFGHGFGFHHAGPLMAGLDAAATYLGMTEAQLHSALAGGKTLAQVAKDKGKTVDGLVTALTNAAKTKLNAAVKAGQLTQQQADDMLSGLQQRLTDLVNGKFPAAPRFEHRFGGAPGRPALRPMFHTA